MCVISVVIPTYNHARYVLQTLDSVFAQTFTDYEVIVVNDGSPDDTAERLRPLAEAGRIRYVEQKNAGQATARNVGIALARGEFIALLDDDDLWPPDKLERQLHALRERPEMDVAYGRVECVDDQGRPVDVRQDDGSPLSWQKDGPSGKIFDAILKQYCLVSPGQTLVRRDALRRLGAAPFDPALWGCDDHDLWLRLARNGQFLFLPHLCLCYRWHSGSASRDKLRMLRNENKLIQKLAREQTTVEQRRLIRERFRRVREQMRNCWAAAAFEATKAGKARASFHCMLRAALLDPRLFTQRWVLAMLLRTGAKALGKGYAA